MILRFDSNHVPYVFDFCSCYHFFQFFNFSIYADLVWLPALEELRNSNGASYTSIRAERWSSMDRRNATALWRIMHERWRLVNEKLRWLWKARISQGICYLNGNCNPWKPWLGESISVYHCSNALPHVVATLYLNSNAYHPVLIANYLDCVNQGWSLLVFAAQAEIGDWKGAWERMQAVNESVFYEAGGNGHSRANSLWYVSTRPDYKKALPTVTGHPSKSPTSTLMPSRPIMNYEKPTARPSYTTTLYPTYSRFGHWRN